MLQARESAHLSQGAERPVLLVASAGGDAEAREAVALVEGRVLDCIAWEEVAARLGDQMRPNALLVEAEAVPDAVLERVLPRIDTFAKATDTPVIVAMGRSQIDLVWEHMSGGRAQLLCEPTLADRVAALAIATEGGGSRWMDDARRGSSEAERLRRLNEEVARIAQVLAELTRTPIKAPRGDSVSDAGLNYAPPPREDLKIDPAAVRKAIRSRRLRETFFASGLFEDPAWDMLLDLFAAELEQSRVSVSSLCIAAAVAPTTALRWIGKMVEIGLFERHPDSHDRRRAFMALSPKARDGLAGYFAAAKRQGLPIA